MNSLHAKHPAHFTRRLGLTLLEVMISTAISAALLVAAGTAFCASSRAIENNDRLFTASQAARVTMGQMMSAFRQCQALQVYSDHVDVITADGHNHTYKYLPALKQVQLITNDVPSNRPFILASNVTSMTFSGDLDATLTKVVRVAVSLTVSVNTSQILLTGAASPRVNQVYQ